MKKNYLIVAGGTGGHIVPALAVAQRVKELEPESEVIFCGVGKEIERKLIVPAGFKLLELPFPPFRGVPLSRKLKFFYELPRSIAKARKLIIENGVTSLIAFGGYPSVCPLIAGWSLKIKTLLHEQNQQVGLANKLLEKFADKVFSVTGSKGFSKPEKVSFLPIPVRARFREVPPPELSKGINLLILGGSQGAKKVNDAVLAIAPFLKEQKINIVHQTGELDLANVKEGYKDYPAAHPRAFIDDVAEALRWSSVVVSRAGAMSVAEISAAGRMAIYVPLQIAGAHQSANIEEVVKVGAALSLNQDSELSNNLKKQLERIIADPQVALVMGNKARELSLSGQSGSEEIIAKALVGK